MGRLRKWLLESITLGVMLLLLGMTGRKEKNEKDEEQWNLDATLDMKGI